jgi:hypothetical protein
MAWYNRVASAGSQFMQGVAKTAVPLLQSRIEEQRREREAVKELERQKQLLKYGVEQRLEGEKQTPGWQSQEWDLNQKRDPNSPENQERDFKLWDERRKKEAWEAQGGAEGEAKRRAAAEARVAAESQARLDQIANEIANDAARRKEQEAARQRAEQEHHQLLQWRRDGIALMADKIRGFKAGELDEAGLAKFGADYHLLGTSEWDDFRTMVSDIRKMKDDPLYELKPDPEGGYLGMPARPLSPAAPAKDPLLAPRAESTATTHNDTLTDPGRMDAAVKMLVDGGRAANEQAARAILGARQAQAIQREALAQPAPGRPGAAPIPDSSLGAPARTSIQPSSSPLLADRPLLPGTPTGTAGVAPPAAQGANGWPVAGLAEKAQEQGPEAGAAVSRGRPPMEPALGAPDSTSTTERMPVLTPEQQAEVEATTPHQVKKFIWENDAKDEVQGIIQMFMTQKPGRSFAEAAAMANAYLEARERRSKR